MKYIKNWTGAVLFIAVYKFLIESFPYLNFFSLERSWLQASLLNLIFVIIVSISCEIIFKSLKKETKIKINYGSFFILAGFVLSFIIILFNIPGTLFDNSLNINFLLYGFYPLAGAAGYVLFNRVTNSAFTMATSIVLIANTLLSFIYVNYFYWKWLLNRLHPLYYKEWSLFFWLFSNTTKYTLCCIWKRVLWFTYCINTPVTWIKTFIYCLWFLIHLKFGLTTMQNMQYLLLFLPMQEPQ